MHQRLVDGLAVQRLDMVAWLVEEAAWRAYRGGLEEEDLPEVLPALTACLQMHPHVLGMAPLGYAADQLAAYYEMECNDAYWAQLPRWQCPCGGPPLVVVDGPAAPGAMIERAQKGWGITMYPETGGAAVQRCPACGRDIRHTIKTTVTGQMAMTV